MSIRTERVAELIQREVAKILQRDYADQLKPMVTITHARVTPDLSIAYLYASVLGDTSAKREAAFKQLEALTSQIRDELASRIRHQLRTVPELKFFLDESLQKAKRMDDLFDRIREERKRREAASPQDSADPVSAQESASPESASLESSSTEPASSPASSEPASSEPASSEPASSEPASSEPASTEPASTQRARPDSASPGTPAAED